MLPILNGAPQGNVLGPMFWLVYVDSVTLDCNIIKYANGLTLIIKVTNDSINLQNYSAVSISCHVSAKIVIKMMIGM